jgi:hypothetical protein
MRNATPIKEEYCMQIDVPTLMNWVISGCIGFFFGVALAWVRFRYERKRDDINWEREKAKLQQQFEQDKGLLALQFQQRINELERTSIEQKNLALREELVRGLDNPEEALRGMRVLVQALRAEANRYYLGRAEYSSALPVLERIEAALVEQSKE